MANTYKIHSKFLNSINEALQKLSSNNEIKILKHPMLEADGNFTSIISSDEKDFDPSKINSNILVDKDEQNEDIIEKKNELTTKAIDKIKQTLDVSDELQSILNEIDKINKDTDYNTWKLNKEKNTANLKSKNAYIFLQNDNICLSHDNQIEIFKSVNELHDWLKKHNYPLPKNIKLHESLNEDNKKLSNKEYLAKLNDFMGDKWFEVFKKFVFDKPLDSEGHTFTDTWIDTRSEEEKNAEKSKAYTKPNAYSKLSKEKVKEFDKLADLKKAYPHWYKQDKIEPKSWGESINEDSFDTSNLWYLVYQNPSRDETFYLNNNWEEGNLLANNLQQAIVFLNREEALNELKKLYNYKKTDYPFKPVQEKEFNECGVTCGSLGPAVQYTANKKDLQEDDLQEMGRLTKGNEHIGLTGLNSGKRLNWEQDAQRNANAETDRNYINNVANSALNRAEEERGSNLWTFNNNANRRYTKDVPDSFLATLKGVGDTTILNKKEFIKKLELLRDQLPKEKQFDVHELIYKDEFGNEKFNSRKPSKSKNPEALQHWRDIRDVWMNTEYTPWSKNNPITKGTGVELTNANRLEGDERIKAFDNLNSYRKNIDDEKYSRNNILNYDETFNGRYQIHLANLLHNDKYKHYVNDFKELLANTQPKKIKQNILSWLTNNIAKVPEEQLSTEQKSFITFGLLELFTELRKNEEDDTILVFNDKDYDAIDAIMSFIMANDYKSNRNKIDDPILQDYLNESISLKNEFLKLLNDKTKNITLTEDDDVPSDFATNIKSDIDSISSDTSTNTAEAPTTNDSDFDIDSSTDTGNSKPDVNFGDINIAGGTGDYGPEEDEEMSNMPIEPVDEYKIIDILVNDDNNEDIKVKVQNQTTGEIETKNLSEIDI